MLLATLVLCACETPTGISRNDTQTQTTTSPLNGIDVSHFQGTVDWATVKSGGHDFAIAKATEGDSVIDRTFDQNWNAMKQAGIVRGAYLFYHAGRDPMKQLQLYISRVDLEAGDLPPVVDIETMNNHHESIAHLSNDLRAILNGLESHYGKKPIIYTGPGFWNRHLDSSFGAYPLWIANYGVRSPTIPDGWTDWSIWQHTQSGRVAGVQTHVDLNYYRGSLRDLQQLGSR